MFRIGSQSADGEGLSAVGRSRIPMDPNGKRQADQSNPKLKRIWLQKKGGGRKKKRGMLFFGIFALELLVA
jgi:hypothetical protein